jgi:hypothetical protein
MDSKITNNIKNVNIKKDIDYFKLLEIIKNKDFNTCTDRELEVYSLLFYNNGYNVDFLKYKNGLKK